MFMEGREESGEKEKRMGQEGKGGSKPSSQHAPPRALGGILRKVEPPDEAPGICPAISSERFYPGSCMNYFCPL